MYSTDSTTRNLATNVIETGAAVGGRSSRYRMMAVSWGDCGSATDTVKPYSVPRSCSSNANTTGRAGSTTEHKITLSGANVYPIWAAPRTSQVP